MRNRVKVVKPFDMTNSVATPELVAAAEPEVVVLLNVAEEPGAVELGMLEDALEDALELAALVSLVVGVDEVDSVSLVLELLQFSEILTGWRIVLILTSWT